MAVLGVILRSNSGKYAKPEKPAEGRRGEIDK